MTRVAPQEGSLEEHAPAFMWGKAWVFRLKDLDIPLDFKPSPTEPPSPEHGGQKPTLKLGNKPLPPGKYITRNEEGGFSVVRVAEPAPDPPPLVVKESPPPQEDESRDPVCIEEEASPPNEPPPF